MSTPLEAARKRINEIDSEMRKLFVDRMRASEEVAEYKRKNGLKVLDPVREAEVIEKNSSAIEDEILRGFYIGFLKGAMEMSRAYQDRLLEGMKVAYCGTEGAFAHIATCKLFPSARKIAYPSFDEAYGSVVSGECDVAVLPTENSYNGEVGQVTDLMFSGSLYVNSMTEIAVTQDLLITPGAKKEDIRTVISHPQALGQCAKYIEKHGYEVKEFSNTALAAKYVAELGDKSVAAIASASAAEIFGLEVLEKNINESRMNTTRFAVLSKIKNKHTESERGIFTVMTFTVRNEAGALAKAIDIIGKHGFNMRTIRSRPMKTLLWQYYFYVEAEGNLDTEDGRMMLAELSEYCDRLKAIGTYTKEEN